MKYSTDTLSVHTAPSQESKTVAGEEIGWDIFIQHFQKGQNRYSDGGLELPDLASEMPQDLEGGTA